MQPKRSLKVAELLRHELSNVIFEEVKDPGIRLCTITRVVVSPDLKIAKVYLSVLGSAEERNAVMQALNRAKAFIRYATGHRATLRYVPELQFYYDDTLDYVANIEKVLSEIKSNTPDAPNSNI